MAHTLSFVRSTEAGCMIQREVSGRYVVSHPSQPDRRLHAATLAGAYAACQGWDAQPLGAGDTGIQP